MNFGFEDIDHLFRKNNNFHIVKLWLIVTY